MYDVAIVGAGPAGLSAALNLQLHNKSILWFGSPELSQKVEKSEKIANYPGLPLISGVDLNQRFHDQLVESGLEITDKMVTSISATRKGFMILGDNDVYEAKSVLLATGTIAAKPLPKEEELLGRGLSYCATCDGFLYRGKIIGVHCGAKRYEHEVAYLAELAEKVYLTVAYPDCELSLDNVELLESPIKELVGETKVSGIKLQNGDIKEIDGLFLLRSSVAPTALLKGIEMEGPHLVVNRRQETSQNGVFAAGDCTGRPYQIAKAIGEGNVAAHSILEYLANEE